MSELNEIDYVADVTIYRVSGDPPAILFKAGMTIDADGAPNCYGPNNSGIDYTANGGDDQGGDDWWGGPTDSKGKPIKQKIYEPFPGMYVSATSHCDPRFTNDSQYRYTDSRCIPFMVMPGNHSNGAKCGDVCLCLNTQTGDNCYGIYADVGPSSKIGEASMRMAEALKISSDPKKGGTSSKIVAYLLFDGSLGKWAPPKDWFNLANKLTKEWGGLSRLKKLLKQI